MADIQTFETYKPLFGWSSREQWEEEMTINDEKVSLLVNLPSWMDDDLERMVENNTDCFSRFQSKSEIIEHAILEFLKNELQLEFVEHAEFGTKKTIRYSPYLLTKEQKESHKLHFNDDDDLGSPYR